MLEAQNGFKSVTDSFIKDFKKAFYQEPVCQQVAYTSKEQNLHTIIKELREENKEIMKMMSKMSSDKGCLPPIRPSNQPPTRPSNQRRTWYYCCSCGAQTSHPSEKYTSEWKLASHKDEATLKT